MVEAQAMLVADKVAEDMERTNTTCNPVPGGTCMFGDCDESRGATYCQ
eukprot:CAMPEP_0168429086 /NCGR_PEP_ID=MMETSP0228-20121227/37191_1 /TAXON_ID=133427 /ORGANISM="Protoceratium reticulatum, Strain CCCM 535 (=CCMP 1889)" /LENGTH=47 /DNA_ID= /DNA_START= /DNA_END= /DNA_ORIENTATION=